MCAQAGTLSTADTNADTPKVRGAKCIYLSIGSEFSLNRLEGRIRERTPLYWAEQQVLVVMRTVDYA